MQWLTGVMKAVFFTSFASIIIILILKESTLWRPGRFLVLNRGYSIFQVPHPDALSPLSGTMGPSPHASP